MTHINPPAAAILSVASSFSLALFVVDQGDRVVHANDLAQRLLAIAGPVALEDGRLVGRTACARRLLRLARAAMHNGSRSAHSCDGLQISTFPVDVDPSDVFGYTRGAAMVSLSGTTVDSVCRRIHVEHRFGATPTEAAIADLVTLGYSVPAISKRLRRSPSTVRTHLKRLFWKAGVRSQRGLAAVIRRGILPVAECV